jgi:Nuclease-related domain
MTNLDAARPAPVGGPVVAAGLGAIEGVETLHARAIPGTRSSIDHIAIGPSGVYVIDTHDHSGRVVRRGNRLFVGSEDRTDLLAAVKVPVDAVASALGDLHLPISRALCFTGGDWPPSSPPFMLNGVWVGSANPLYWLVAQPGRLTAREIDAAARLLDERLPAAG